MRKNYIGRLGIYIIAQDFNVGFQLMNIEKSLLVDYYGNLIAMVIKEPQRY